MKRLAFPKSKRLISNRQFKDVLARGVRVSNGMLTLYIAENNFGYPRLGVSVSKSCGKAAVRNRLKRLLRETFRQNQDKIPAGFDYLLIILPEWLRQEDKPASVEKNVVRPEFGRIKASFLVLVDAAESLIKNRKNSH